VKRPGSRRSNSRRVGRRHCRASLVNAESGRGCGHLHRGGSDGRCGLPSTLLYREWRELITTVLTNRFPWPLAPLPVSFMAAMWVCLRAAGYKEPRTLHVRGGNGAWNNYVADGRQHLPTAVLGGISGLFACYDSAFDQGITVFVKEVQRYENRRFASAIGKSTGGDVQIVTKSGKQCALHRLLWGGYFRTTEAHASDAQVLRRISAFFGGPQARIQLQGKILSSEQLRWDAQTQWLCSGLKNHLFFIGAFARSGNNRLHPIAQY